MFDFNDILPEILKIKGYKYRAKMILAALVVLIVVIVIISWITGKVSSSSKEKEANNSSQQTVSSQVDKTDSESTVSESIESKKEDISSKTDSVTSAKDYSTDADGKVIIDTDVYDGKKAVAITFDDGPGEYTEELINGLNKRKAKATFFMVGSCISEYPNALTMMVEGGHQIGSHTYDHSDITTLTKKQIDEQLSKTDNAIFEACGQTASAFRPPYGSYNDKIISEMNKTISLWSLDSEDWVSRDADKVKKKIVSSCQDGDIILLHDIYKTSVDGALEAIDELQKQGYIFVTVDELISRYGYDVVHGKAYTAQYALYETNSPYAEKYESELAASKAAVDASSAASAFYYNSSSNLSSESSVSDNVNSTESKLIY